MGSSTKFSASAFFKPLAKILLKHKVKHIKNAPSTTTRAQFIFVENRVVLGY